ncbi:MAG: hypothetical protein KDD82_19810 [Planctomycetes bacterium]|nr:hypothetical protein [Planctomycetota bacterium]
MSARLALSLTLVAACAWAEDQPAQDPTTYDLKPRYALDAELEGEASLNLELTVRMQVPAKNIDHRSLQAQEIVRRFRDKVTSVAGGKVAAVTRTYLEAIERQRLPGSQKYERLESPLHGRTLTVGLDAEGKRTVGVEGKPALTAKDTEHEVYTERYEAALPDSPVAVGDTWSWSGARLRRAIGNGFGESPEGKIDCRFVEVKDEVLDPELTPDAAPEAYALIQVDLETEGRMGPQPDSPSMTCHLTGTLWYSLAERKLAKVELQGQAHIKSVEREDGVELTITASGPLKIAKRFWFPRKPEPPAGDAPTDPETGLPTPPERPGR